MEESEKNLDEKMKNGVLDKFLSELTYAQSEADRVSMETPFTPVIAGNPRSTGKRNNSIRATKGGSALLSSSNKRSDEDGGGYDDDGGDAVDFANNSFADFFDHNLDEPEEASTYASVLLQSRERAVKIQTEPALQKEKVVQVSEEEVKEEEEEKV